MAEGWGAVWEEAGAIKNPIFCTAINCTTAASAVFTTLFSSSFSQGIGVTHAKKTDRNLVFFSQAAKKRSRTNTGFPNEQLSSFSFFFFENGFYVGSRLSGRSTSTEAPSSSSSSSSLSFLLLLLLGEGASKEEEEEGEEFFSLGEEGGGGGRGIIKHCEKKKGKGVVCFAFYRGKFLFSSPLSTCSALVKA